MATWDRRSPAQLAAQREAAVRAQVLDVVGPFSPWWRERLRALGRAPGDVASVRGLALLPAAGERDVCPDGDPAGAAALVVQVGEAGYALHAEGPALRRALGRRLVSRTGYRAVVEADTRPTSYAWAGLALRFPLASTRGDLDVVARAGARMWQVLGLDRSDVLVAAVPTAPAAAHGALSLGALGAGAPALFPGEDVEDVAEALRLVPATVLAVGSAEAARTVSDVAAAGGPLTSLRTLLLVGAPYDEERAAVRAALAAAGAPDPVVLAVHAPDGHRLAWAECRPGASGTGGGLHTYPDLDLVQPVDPETGEAGRDRSGRFEPALTQLGMRGSAMLRWRTGDLADGLSEEPCPACGRTVPRLLGLRRGALVPLLGLGVGERPVDLRAVTAALLGRGDLADWRVQVSRRRRTGADRLLVHVAERPGSVVVDAVLAVAADVLATAGVLPDQVVLGRVGRLPEGAGLSRRVLLDRTPEPAGRLR